MQESRRRCTRIIFQFVFTQWDDYLRTLQAVIAPDDKPCPKGELLECVSRRLFVELI
jgi:hypothetical protein